MSAPAPGRRSEHARRAILDATLRLCGEVGYHKLRIEAIARRAGTGKQTIYRWWPSIGALVMDAVFDSAGQSSVFPDTGDVCEDLCQQMLAVAGFMDSTGLGPGYWAVLAAAHDEPEFGDRFRDVFIGERRQACVDRLDRARQCGELRADSDLELLVDQLYAPLYYRFVVTCQPIDDIFIRAHVATLFSVYRPASNQATASRESPAGGSSP